MDISEEAKRARRLYMQEWRKKNPERVKQYTANYWERKGASVDEPIENRILKLHEQGFSLREIALKIGTNHVHVSRILKRYR